LRRRLAASATAFRGAFANPDLRRIQLAGAASVIGNWSYGIALAVYAYRAGGATAVGVLGVVKLLPAAVGAPAVAMLADRLPRRRVMLAADLLRAAAMAAATLAVLGDAPAAVVFGIAAVTTVVGTAFRPAQAALLPSLARSPQELTAANVAASTVDSVGSFVGPALGGALLVLTEVEWVFALNGLTFLWSALLVARLSTDGAPRAAGRSSSRLAEMGAGFSAIGGNGRVRLLVGLYGLQTFVDGMRPVLVVTAALTVLEVGESGVGYLNSALGVGGLAGAAIAFSLAARGRLGTDFAAGLALWGIGLSLVGVWPETAPALLFLAVLGVGNTLVDVSGLTLLQRSAPDEVLARVFGALDSLLLGTTMLGALVAPALVEAIGVRAALVAGGLLLPVAAIACMRALGRLDAAPPPEAALLAAIPMFAPLPQATLEQLAGSLTAVDVSAGDVVVRRGDPGDRFYAVEEGEVVVELEGREPERLGRGDWFGEIALLRDVPRTATVRAVGDSRLLALDRDEFLAAVTGNAASAEVAEAVVAARLGAAPRPELGM
jgi:MFS family permease